jgi:DNA-directed RNA polymerase specialized sigma54-like protein
MINIEQLKQEVSEVTHEFDRKVAMQVIDYLHEHGYLKGVKANTRNGN